MLEGEKVRQAMLSPLKQRLFLWSKLPGAAFMGCRIDAFETVTTKVSLPMGWRSQNPFRSIYFAAQCAAAELSTGLLALYYVSNANKPVSMLVANMNAEFVKKATSRTVFTCVQGNDFKNAIERAILTGEGQTLTVDSIGVQMSGEIVSRFSFTWTFKVK